MLELIDDPFMVPPGPRACIPGLTIDLTQRVRRMQRASLLKDYLDLGAAMAECAESMPTSRPPRRRRWYRGD